MLHSRNTLPDHVAFVLGLSFAHSGWPFALQVIKLNLDRAGDSVTGQTVVDPKVISPLLR